MNRNTFEPGPLADVACLSSGQGWTLVFVRQLAQPPEVVWAALTDPDQLRVWAPFDANRDLTTPGAATLSMVNADGSAAEHAPAMVSRAERPTLLEFTWGTDLLRWELVASGSGTRLTLHHTVNDREWLSKVAAGWHICLAVAERYLEGNPVGRIVADNALNYGWTDLEHAYAARLSQEQPVSH
jgi:uncharacterized protein YndB with AHSA1/START domain